MKKNISVVHARTLLRQSELGVLSTHSKSNEGFPFGSVATYLSTMNGDVVFYISDLAQHTKNIKHNGKMCLTVFANAEGSPQGVRNDPNAGARLSILGHASLLDNNTIAKTKERYFTLYPESRKYQGTHDFNFYRLTFERARFIGGFGDIHWISENEWHLQTPDWLENEQSMIEHMNEDHMDAMQLLYQHQTGLQADDTEMLALSPDGCFICTNNRKPVFIPFNEIANTGQEIRQQLVALTQTARASLSATTLDSNESKPAHNVHH